MKITKEDYTRLEKLIHETVEKNPTAIDLHAQIEIAREALRMAQG